MNRLFPSKARYLFTQYMPSKPDKFGIFWLATDVDSKYMLNGFPYLGKAEERAENLSLSEYIVLRLMEPSKIKEEASHYR
ncbi:piggyBac transposable element-derived 4-like protein [Trichonephila clavipes]|nr:piggyBac transposable element-derived 4-like protein [Trichonephila clavipes]